jgi:inner membrane protein
LDPLRVGAYPTWVNPFQWHGVVETRNFFALAQVDSSVPEVDPSDNMEIRYKPEETPVTLAAKTSYLGRVYLDWAKFPVTETEPQADGLSVVRFEDLRFSGTWRRSTSKPLSAGVVVDQNIRVVREFFGRVPQPPD